MKVRSIITVWVTLVAASSCTTQKASESENHPLPEVQFVEHEAGKSVDVTVDGKVFTTYRWPDNVYKPILYPLYTSNGTAITRGFPLQPREGERNDHMHQVGNWLTYGNVNGYDFWGNGSTGQKDPNGGVIEHRRIERVTPGKGEGSMVSAASWLDPAGKELLAETTEFHFIARDSVRVIDRITTLTASAGIPVVFKDTKEGMFGIRVARQLELPSQEELTLTDAQGNPTTVAKMPNEGVSGNYRSSEGITGEKVWSTRAKWMDLYGNIGNEKISLVICDHPDNISYPTYWHARGYGLFSANPFGAKDFTEGKTELNYSLPAGQSLTFKYRIIISSGSHLSDAQINAYADDFAKQY
jgi:hypothetical protein